MTIKYFRKNVFGRTNIAAIILMIILIIIPTLYFIPEPPIKAEIGGTQDRAYYGTLLCRTPSLKLFCPRFEQSTTWDTSIVVFNPDDADTATITISFYKENGNLIDSVEDIEIDALNTLIFTPNDYGVTDNTGNIVIESDLNIVGSIIRRSSYSAASEPLQWTDDTSQGSRTLYCPKFIQATNWETWICLYYNNDGGSPISVNFHFYDLNGIFLGTKIVPVSPKQTLYQRPLDMGIFSSYGNIIIETIVPSGGVLLGYTLRNNGIDCLSYSEPLARSLTEIAYSSYFLYNKEGIEIETEIILNNPTSTLITTYFDIYSDSGALIGSENTQILPHSTITLEISEYTTYPVGTIYFSSTSANFIGFSALIGNLGFGFSTELILSPSEIIYFPGILEPDDMETGGFRSNMLVSNLDDESIEIDIDLLDLYGNVEYSFSDVELVDNGVNMVFPIEEVEYIGSGILMEDGISSIYIDGWAYNRWVEILFCDNCLGEGCDWTDEDCSCNQINCKGKTYCKDPPMQGEQGGCVGRGCSLSTNQCPGLKCKVHGNWNCGGKTVCNGGGGLCGKASCGCDTGDCPRATGVKFCQKQGNNCQCGWFGCNCINVYCKFVPGGGSYCPIYTPTPTKCSCSCDNVPEALCTDQLRQRCRSAYKCPGSAGGCGGQRC
jgi:hypothetical protein